MSAIVVALKLLKEIDFEAEPHTPMRVTRTPRDAFTAVYLTSLEVEQILLFLTGIGIIEQEKLERQ